MNQPDVVDTEILPTDPSDVAAARHDVDRGDSPSLLVTPSEEALKALDELAKSLGAADRGGDGGAPAADRDNAGHPAGEKSDEPPRASETDSVPVDEGVGKGADQRPVKDEFDDIQLPPTAKAKSAMAFEALKKAARETRQKLEAELTETRKQIEQLKQELAEARAKSGKVPPEVERELEELRRFRMAHEVEYDPAVREIDGRIRTNVELIYKKLLANGLTEEQIAKIRELGGPEHVDWGPILEKLPFHVSRFIEAKLVENEGLREQRNEVYQKARERADEYRTELHARRTEAVWQNVENLFKHIPDLQVKQVPPTASDEERKQIESHNRAVLELRALAKEWAADLSESRVAELIIGTALAHRYKRAIDAVADTIKNMKERLDSVTQERDNLKKELGKLKQAEAPRSRGNVPPQRTTGGSIFRDGAEVLDELAAEVLRGSST